MANARHVYYIMLCTLGVVDMLRLCCVYLDEGVDHWLMKPAQTCRANCGTGIISVVISCSCNPQEVLVSSQRILK